LTRIYEQIRIINVHVANLLRSAVASDPAINAVILLDIFSQSLPMVIEESLDSIRYLYEAMTL
jgi:DNA-binding transcriptional regulator WhiA